MLNIRSSGVLAGVAGSMLLAAAAPAQAGHTSFSISIGAGPICRTPCAPSRVVVCEPVPVYGACTTAQVGCDGRYWPRGRYGGDCGPSPVDVAYAAGYRDGARDIREVRHRGRGHGRW